MVAFYIFVNSSCCTQPVCLNAQHTVLDRLKDDSITESTAPFMAWSTALVAMDPRLLLFVLASSSHRASQQILSLAYKFMLCSFTLEVEASGWGLNCWPARAAKPLCLRSLYRRGSTDNVPIINYPFF
jgi:hypothetical protein